MSLEELTSDKNTLLNWLQYCLKRQDWHGVMDAAADIREIEVIEPMKVVNA